MESNHELNLIDCVLLVGTGDFPKVLEHQEGDLTVTDAFEFLPSGDLPKKHDPIRDHYQPTLTHIYPNSFDDPVMRDVALFCFPENIRLRATSMNEVTFFTFAMTNVNGTRRYAACLTFYDPLPTSVTARLLKSHISSPVGFSRMRSGSTIDGNPSRDRSHSDDTLETLPTYFAPKCLCFISHWPYFDTFKSLLFHIYMMCHSDSLAFPLEHVLAELVQVIPAPPPGDVHLRFHVYGTNFTISRPSLNDLPTLDLSLKHLFNCLGVKDILTLFVSVLTEQKILFVSRSVGLLHIASESMLALLYPFTWLHTYIPVLPTRLFETLSAPVPFIMGISSNHMDKVPELTDVIIVDLDLHTVKVPASVTLPCLPTNEMNILATSLSHLAYPELRYFDKIFIPVYSRTPKGVQTQPVMRRELPEEFRRHSSSAHGDDFPLPSLAKHQAKDFRIHHSQSFANTPHASPGAIPDTPIFEQHKIRISFLKFFVSIMKDVNKYLLTVGKQKIFNGDEFMKTQPIESRNFYQVFFATQMFRRFVDDMNLRSRYMMASVFDRLLDPVSEKIDRNVDLHQHIDRCILLDIPGPEISLNQESVCYGHIFPDLDYKQYSTPNVSKLLTILNESIQKHPNVPQFFYLRAFVYEKMNELLKAVADCEIVWNMNIGILPPKMIDRIVEKMSMAQLAEAEDIGFKVAEVARKVRAIRNPAHYGGSAPLVDRESSDGPVVFANTGIDFVEVLAILGLAENGCVSKETFIQYSSRLSLADDTFIAGLLFDALGDNQECESIPVSTLEAYLHVFTTVCNQTPERLVLEDKEIVIRCSSKAYDKSAVAGHVILTNQQIYFGSEQFTPVVKLDKIQRCEEFSYRVLVPPGMPCIRILTAKDEITFCFWSFPEREIWVAYLNEVCAANQMAHERPENYTIIPKTMNNLLRTEALSIMKKRSVTSLLFLKDDFNKANEDFLQNVKMQKNRKWSSNSTHLEYMPGLDRITDASQLSEAMCKLILQNFYIYVDMSTKSVDSQKFCTCEAFRQYMSYMHSLKMVKLGSLNDDQRIAFFLNIYNALIVHMYAVYGVTATLQKKWNSQLSKYQIGDDLYSIDDIKHGVLRANRPRRRRVIVLECRQFEKSDPRLKYVPTKFDPRVNFALCKHTHISPSVKIYTAANLDQDLHHATEEYCQLFISVNHQKKEIRMPKVFYFCESDFGKDQEEMLRWVSAYTTQPVTRAIQAFIDKTVDYNLTFDNDSTFEPKPFHQSD
eukprot:TRINITY_DN7468_c0_g1_i2.p1 TRINITY_DN7468_c0_g1~~TRINITY_DN7468_c0_g1_i2.p1  ORF type:complete len:1247 (+),score=193.11 TRINITY_DN7468_c0_g1_i2:46-3786(+)